MLVKHEVQKDVGVVDSVTLCAVFQEAHTIVNDMVEAHKLLKSFCEDPYDEFELADDLEALSVFDYSNITKFKMWFASKSLVTNKYLGKTYHKMGILEKKLSAAVDCSCALNEDEFAALRDLTYDVASGMLFFIISEFDIFNLANADKSTNYPVDEIVDVFCKKIGKDPVDLANELVGLSKEYRMKISLFDSFPEYEDEFYKVMGPALSEVDGDSLTVEQVLSVIRGEISPDDLAEQMRQAIVTELSGVQEVTSF